MSKQIYIDSNGNEIQVSGTVNTADMMPMSGNDSTKVKTAIGDLSQLTTTDKSSLVGAVNSIGKGTYSTTGLIYNNSSLQDGGYYKLGNIVLVNLRIKLTSAFTGGNPVVSGLPVPNSANNMVTFSTNQTKTGILSTTGQIILVENLAIDTIVMINGIYLTT